MTSEKLLQTMAVPSYPGVFVLGSFARYVTVYSQQVRALNLIDALCRRGMLSRHTRVAVIGGGVAGLTAAAGAAVLGAPVRLYERAAKPLRLQRNCGHRWLHPHLYDWPERESDSREAGLPLLTWEAGWAQDVAKRIEAQWDHIRQLEGVTLDPVFDVEDISLARSPVKDLTQVSWKQRGEAFQEELFHIVILALGFGEEVDSPQSYWAEDPLAFHELGEPRWVVSGTGDGGLTDLMRLCLDLKHEDILQTVVAENGLESIKRELLEASSKDDFQALSSKLEVQPLVKKFCGKLRNVRVFVCGRQPDLYSAGSAILNRFIVALIAQAQEVVGRQIFVYIPYEIERVQEQEKIVTFKNGQDVEEINPKHIVQRHGTASALQEYFRNIWDDCATLRTIWQKFLQGCDDTRKKHFCPEHFVPETPPNRSRLRISFGEKVGCVVITSEKASGGKVREVVHFALARATAAVFDMTGRVLDVQDVAISINEALEAPAAYDRTVRALCEAEIVVFDVTGYEPGVMLLLGIRSVARRGVTLTLTGDRLDAEMWSKMPFNLKEIYPIPYGPEEHDPAGVVVKAMLDGLSLLHTLPNRYLDLPAFDAVREYARPLTTHRDQTTGQHTLLLCSFDKDYLEGPGRTLQNSLGTLEHHRKLGKPVRIVDVVSPRLVSQKLYAEIRQAPVCVVDWTEWKSNVFYELGVRVAASDLGAVCVINPDYLNKEAIQPPKQLKQHKQLQQLFDPLRYRKLEEEADFKQEELFREQLCERAHNAHLLGAVVDEKSGYLRPSHTYDLLVDTIALAQEPGSAKVHELLGHMAEAMQGGEPLRQARLPVLFTENTRLSAQVRQQTLEYLIGAWYYLRERHGFKNLAKVAQSPLVAEYAALTDKLFVLLRDAPQADNKPLIAALRKALRQLPQTDRGGSHLLLEVDALRNQAKSCKACNKPDEAANLMQQAIARLRDKLNEPIEQQKSVLAWQNLLKSELADCYGSLGGILRAQRNLQAAWEAYDEGLVYEADHTSGYMNAYCQVQRLVARLEDSRHTWMAEWIPDPKKGGHLVHFGEAMTKARDEIEEQLRSMRRGDSWALADLAILSLLLNEEDKADTVWQAFERSNPSKSAYESVERTLRTLADALGANHKDSGVPDGICTALRDAADRLQRMQMSH